MNARLDQLFRIDPSWLLDSGQSDWTPPVGLARLCRWPDLNEVPDEMVMSVARILALLGSKPTATHLINRQLAGERDETHRALQALAALGHIEFISIAAPGVKDTAPHLATTESPEATTATGFGSFIGKLRQRLLG